MSPLLIGPISQSRPNVLQRAWNIGKAFVLNLRTKRAPDNLQSVSSRGGWWPIIRESWAGAWQANVEVRLEDVLTHPTVFACITLIASDIAKMRVKLVQQDSLETDIWSEVESPSFSPFLRKPNRYQNRIRFWELWMLSKLIHGNTYVLKQRDDRNVVRAGYVLDPTRVRPMVAPDGSVWYELSRDDLSQQPQDRVLVPASEIIHDLIYPFYHPLVGISPISAAGLAAILGTRIQNTWALFHGNQGMPGGILTAPGHISQPVADDMKVRWEANYGGNNRGAVAILGDGLEFKAVQMMSAVDQEIIESLKWGDEAICRVFHVPAYMVGVGPLPNFNNIDALSKQYHAQCLQIHLEGIELSLDEGLGLSPDKIEGKRLGTEFDLDNLQRMDQQSLITTESEAVKGSLKKINEARRRLNLPPVDGGDTIYRQQQDFDIRALAERDANKPFSKPDTPTPAPVAQAPQTDDADGEKALLLVKTLERLHRAA